MKEVVHRVGGQQLVLLPEKALLWKEKSMLVISDLHLGKAGHFRKAGIPVSSAIHTRDLEVLDALCRRHKPESVLFLGDLFHSTHNSEWQFLQEWIYARPEIMFILVKGNHDILPGQMYSESNLWVCRHGHQEGPFVFCHEPPEEKPPVGKYVLCGHIHPGVKLQGAGRQALSLPCFYFGPDTGILPAFGQFTGQVCLAVSGQEHIYVVAGRQVVRM